MKVFQETENETKPKKCRRKLKREAKKYLREFSEATTLHGFRFIGEENAHFFERLCWSIAIVICAVFCGLEITKLWHRWQNSPVIISFEQNPTSVASIPYPGLTICPENKIKRSVIDMEENYNKIEAQLNGTMQFESKEEKLLAESISMLCNKKSRGFELKLPRIKPSKDHLTFIGGTLSPQIEDIFEACYYESLEIDCNKIFRPVIMFHGICYVFNILDDKDLYTSNVDRFPLEGLKREDNILTWDPEKGYKGSGKAKSDEFPLRNGVYNGPRFGLQFILKSDPEELQEICSLKDADLFRVSLQAPTELPDPFYGNHFHVTPGSETSISLRPSTITTAPELRGYKPHLRGCNYPEDKPLKLFRTYTQTNCIWECQNRAVRDNCGCQFFYMPYLKNDNASICAVYDVIPAECGQDFLEMIDNMFYYSVEEKIDSEGTAAACDCLPSCLETSYQFHVSHSEYRPFQHYNTSLQYAAINLYYESASFFGKHRSELYGVTDFIASCGGLLGLFSGFSLITAIEIFYFATLRLFCKLRRRRQVIQENSE